MIVKMDYHEIKINRMNLLVATILVLELSCKSKPQHLKKLLSIYLRPDKNFFYFWKMNDHSYET